MASLAFSNFSGRAPRRRAGAAAPGFPGPSVELEDITEDDFHRHFNTNVLGTLLTTKEAAKYFGPNGGSVINISSVASETATPTASVYSATKGAVDTLSRVLAAELGPRKIRVNVIAPGGVETEGTHAAGVIGSDSRNL